jgi:hypothetical protein
MDKTNAALRIITFEQLAECIELFKVRRFDAVRKFKSYMGLTDTLTAHDILHAIVLEWE